MTRRPGMEKNFFAVDDDYVLRNVGMAKMAIHFPQEGILCADAVTLLENIFRLGTCGSLIFRFRYSRAD